MELGLAGFLLAPFLLTISSCFAFLSMLFLIRFAVKLLLLCFAQIFSLCYITVQDSQEYVRPLA